MIWYLTAQFKRTGSVSDLPFRDPKHTVHNDTAVQLSVFEDPSSFTHHHSDQQGIARTSLQKILKLDLKMFLYKIQMIQSLPPQYAI